MDLGQLIKLGAEIKEQEKSRSLFGGIATHGDEHNRGQRNWRYALIDQGGGATALRINDGGPHCKQWNLERDEYAPERINGEYAAKRIGDLSGEWNKSKSLRHPEDEGVHQEGTLQAHKATADEIYATMQDGKGNGTFRLIKGDGDKWKLKFGPRPKGVNDFAGDFVRGVKKEAGLNIGARLSSVLHDASLIAGRRWHEMDPATVDRLTGTCWGNIHPEDRLIQGATAGGLAGMAGMATALGGTIAYDAARNWTTVKPEEARGSTSTPAPAQQSNQNAAVAIAAPASTPLTQSAVPRPVVDTTVKSPVLSDHPSWFGGQLTLGGLGILAAGGGLAAYLNHRRSKKNEVKIASAFIRDRTLISLPDDVRADIKRFVPDMKHKCCIHYGMVVKELIAKADPHNLATARKHVRDIPEKKLEKEFYDQKDKKFILVNYDKVVDGHHFLAKAERVGCTSSLNVLDITGCHSDNRKTAELAGTGLGELIKDAGVGSFWREAERFSENRSLQKEHLGRIAEIHGKFPDLESIQPEDIAGIPGLYAKARGDMDSLKFYSKILGDSTNRGLRNRAILGTGAGAAGFGIGTGIDKGTEVLAEKINNGDFSPSTAPTTNVDPQVNAKDQAAAFLNRIGQAVHLPSPTQMAVGGSALALGAGGLVAYLHHRKQNRQQDVQAKTAGGGTDGKLSCLMAPVDKNDSLYNQLIEFAHSIERDDLYVGEDGKFEGGKYGMEVDLHVTVCWGFTDNSPEPVEKYVKDHAPLRLTLDKLSAFPGGDSKPYDVLKWDVKSEELEKLNSDLRKKFEVEDSHPVFHGHLTTAYLKNGRAGKYLSRNKLEGRAYTASQLTFSDPQKKHTTIELSGSAKTASPATGMLGASLPAPNPLPQAAKVLAHPEGTTIKPIDPMRSAYGSSLPSILSQARSYQSAHPNVNFVNKLDPQTLSHPVQVNSSRSALSDKGTDGEGLGGVVLGETIGAKQPSRVNIVTNPRINDRVGGTIDHELLHTTQDLSRNPSLMATPGRGDKSDQYQMLDAEVEARLPRLNRSWVQEGNQFPKSPEDADKVLNSYGFLPPGKRPPDPELPDGETEPVPVPGHPEAMVSGPKYKDNPEWLDYHHRTENLPSDIDDLRRSYMNLPDQERAKMYERIRQIQPGVVQNQRPSVVPKIATGNLDTFSYPLTGPIGSSTLAAAGLGAGTMGILHAYRAAKRKLTGERPDPEEHSFIGDVGRGALLGAAGNVAFKGLTGVMGGPRPVVDNPVPYDFPLHHPMVGNPLKYSDTISSTPIGDNSPDPNKQASIDPHQLMAMIQQDHSLSWHDKQSLIDMANQANRSGASLDPQELYAAGFGALAAWLVSRFTGFGSFGQGAAALAGAGLGALIQHGQSNPDEIGGQGWYRP